MREHQKDTSLVEQQLTLKTEEAEAFQAQLGTQKKENQKLRDKVKELLTKCSQSSVSSDHMNSDEQQQSMLQAHEMELSTLKQMSQQKIDHVQEQLNFFTQKCQRVEQELQNSQEQTRDQEQQTRLSFDQKIAQINDNCRQEIERITQEKDQFMNQLNQMSTQVQSSGQNDLDEKQKQLNQAQISNQDLQRQLEQYKSIVQNKDQEIKSSQQQMGDMNGQIHNLKSSKQQIEFQNQELSQNLGSYENENQNLKNIIQKQEQQLAQKSEVQSSSNGFTIKTQEEPKSQSQSQPDVSTNSWQVLESDNNQSQTYIAEDSLRSSNSPLPPKDINSINRKPEPKQDPLLIQSNYFGDYKQITESFGQEKEQAQNYIDKGQQILGATNYQELKSVQEQKSENLKPRENNCYDFTLDGEGAIKQQEETNSLFAVETETIKTEQVEAQKQQKMSQDPHSFFDQMPKQAEKAETQIASNQPVQQPEKQPEQKAAVIINSNPYNFFDNEDDDAGEQPVQVGTNVIPNSMFD